MQIEIKHAEPWHTRKFDRLHNIFPGERKFFVLWEAECKKQAFINKRLVTGPYNVNAPTSVPSHRYTAADFPNEWLEDDADAEHEVDLGVD